MQAGIAADARYHGTKESSVFFVIDFKFSSGKASATGIGFENINIRFLIVHSFQISLTGNRVYVYSPGHLLSVPGRIARRKRCLYDIYGCIVPVKLFTVSIAVAVRRHRTKKSTALPVIDIKDRACQALVFRIDFMNTDFCVGCIYDRISAINMSPSVRNLYNKFRMHSVLRGIPCRELCFNDIKDIVILVKMSSRITVFVRSHASNLICITRIRINREDCTRQRIRVGIHFIDIDVGTWNMVIRYHKHDILVGPAYRLIQVRSVNNILHR